MIPLVVAIERGIAQTGIVLAIPGLKDRYILIVIRNGSFLESYTVGSESPVHVIIIINKRYPE